jgi:hypothetical protein
MLFEEGCFLTWPQVTLMFIDDKYVGTYASFQTFFAVKQTKGISTVIFSLSSFVGQLMLLLEISLCQSTM